MIFDASARADVVPEGGTTLLARRPRFMVGPGSIAGRF
jgi:hypothetical protein